MRIQATLEKIVRSTAQRFGFDLHRHHPERCAHAQFITMLASHGVSQIFDVGANAGQFGKSLRDGGYRGQIISFEPLSAAHQRITAASRDDPLWEVAPRVAIGSENGEIEIHVAGNSVSSSVLSMLDSHVRAAPDSSYISHEKVPLRRLDSIGSEYLHSGSVPFLKVDTQGYESHVLQGASGILGNFVGLQLELSLVPLYENQCLFDDMFVQLKQLGFELWAISPVFHDPVSARLLQIDATFFRHEG